MFKKKKEVLGGLFSIVRVLKQIIVPMSGNARKISLLMQDGYNCIQTFCV